jgi:hypothetical protein
VKFINTDGMAFIGPGSEWFWTALSGIVLAVTFLAIYRQLRLQRSQAANEQIHSFVREWKSERLLSYRLDILVALQGGAAPADAPSAAAGMLCDYWEAIATLARAGHLDLWLLWNNDGNQCLLWWGLLRPYARATREGMQDRTVYENFEWLAGEMQTLDRRAGVGAVYDEAHIAPQLDGMVATLRERLRFERSLRTVYLTSREDAPVSAPAAAQD